MTKLQRVWIALLVLLFTGIYQSVGQRGGVRGPQSDAQQLFAMANRSRAQSGAGPLRWDAALAEAALRHCQRMVAEGPIAHRYGGEPDLSERASQAGAHFSLIEENIAVGDNPRQIHQGWMNSPGHRTNLLNPAVDRVGIAVIAVRGVIYAAADYAKAVPVLSLDQVEAEIGNLIRRSGIAVRNDPHDARAACVLDHGFPATRSGGEAGFVMRWQGADLNHLPQQLVDKLGSRQYRQADVGVCAPRGDQLAFTQYRIAVLLY